MEITQKYARSPGRMGVDAFVPQGDLTEVPLCTHGPALLFERYTKNHSFRRFFACSACRARKDCPLFVWEEDKLSDAKLQLRQKAKEEITKKAEELEHGKHLKLKGAAMLSYCRKCDALLADSDGSKHELHDKIRVTESDIRNPTRILAPLDNKKSNAQFIFSDESCRFLSNLICHLGFSRVLCVGTPKLHETLMNLNLGTKLKTLLLDIDSRYAQFNTRESYCWYNMFNNYFFDPNSRSVLMDFLRCEQRGDLVIIIDPPFGGLMSILGQTIQSMWDDWRHINSVTTNENPSTILVFPYFLESHVTEAIPSLVMMDYKVTYKNHCTYKSRTKATQKGSPVRLFSNIDPEDFVLPMEEGYYFCSFCRRYSSQENKHCKICSRCTSKDGRTYVHCDQCKKCVKPGRIHCLLCSSCELPGHPCGTERTQLTCHFCAEFGHKRQNCPLKEKTVKRSRSQSDKSLACLKKRKRK